MEPPLPSVDERLEALSRVLEADPRFAAAVVFGSACTRQLRVDSDVDLAVLYADASSRDSVAQDVLTVLGRLGQATGRDVDLVELDRAPVALRRAVLDRGRLLFDRSGSRLHDLRISTAIEYADGEHARAIADAALDRQLATLARTNG